MNGPAVSEAQNETNPTNHTFVSQNRMNVLDPVDAIQRLRRPSPIGYRRITPFLEVTMLEIKLLVEGGRGFGCCGRVCWS